MGRPSSGGVGGPVTEHSGGARRLRIGDDVHEIDRPWIMGIVNATPDSFSDAGEHQTVDDRVALGRGHAADGAQVVDIGGQSGITGVSEIDPSEEIARVLPVVDGLRRESTVLTSVDTYKPAVVRAVLGAGASIINDVSGLLYPGVAEICAEHRSALVLMHNRSRPKERLTDPHLYTDVVDDVVSFIDEKMRLSVSLGVDEESIILDPGPDFSKTPFQTIETLRAIDRVLAFGRPVLLALSRKDFVGALTRRSPRDRLAGTLAAIGSLLEHPGLILRVHDVAPVADYLRVADALAGRTPVVPDLELPVELRRHRAG